MRRDGVEIVRCSFSLLYMHADTLKSSHDQTSLKSFYTQTILPLFLSLPSYPPTPFAPTLSLSLFLKIYSLCSSRSFHIDTFHNLALVPLADLFNHEDSNSVSFVSEQWVCEDCGKFQRCQHDDVDSVGEEEGEKGEGEGEEDDDTCELITVVSIESGREVFNSYGTLSNARLLRDYGFMLEANLNDLIEFELEEVLLLLVVGGGGAGAGEEMRVRVREEWERVREVWYNGRLKEEEEERGDEEFVVFDSTRRLYIDADSRLSSSLWLLLVCLFVALPKDPIRRGKFLGLLGGGEGGDLQPMVMRAKKSLAEGVGKLVEMRLQSQFRPELSGGELLDLAEVRFLLFPRLTPPFLLLILFATRTADSRFRNEEFNGIDCERKVVVGDFEGELERGCCCRWRVNSTRCCCTCCSASGRATLAV